jgi:hypothetical protein
MQGIRSWRFLEDNPAVCDPGWLPPEEDCGELADLRPEHHRLLAARADALNTLGEVRRQHREQQEARGQALTDALLTGKREPAPAKTKVTEQDIEQAQLRFEAASDALEKFCRNAVTTVVERSPTIAANLTERQRQAERTRAEARRLLAEADRLAAEPTRLRDWVARATGESTLGLYPFDAIGLPVRPPVPQLVEELAGLRPGEVIDVGGDDISEEIEVMNNAG